MSEGGFLVASTTKRTHSVERFIPKILEFTNTDISTIKRKYKRVKSILDNGFASGRTNVLFHASP